MSPTLGNTARLLTGLVGEDIGASRSPWLHEREAEALGVRLIYMLYDLASADEGPESLAQILQAAKRMRFSGLNITHPYKQRVMNLLDEVSEEAVRIGAVNTVAIREGRSIGYNTDCLGFAESLRRGLAGEKFDTVLQLGAGGAGSATSYALLEHGTRLLQIHDVDGHRAQALVTNLASIFGSEKVEVAGDIGAAASSADGIVNATPIGMTGHDGTPLPLQLVGAGQWIADIIYFPLETELLRHARALGCRTLDGVAMVVFQAAAAFEIFTGLRPDPERMLAGALHNWKG